MKANLSMNEPKMFKFIINKNLVHIQVKFLNIEFARSWLVHIINAFFSIIVKNDCNDRIMYNVIKNNNIYHVSTHLTLICEIISLKRLQDS